MAKSRLLKRPAALLSGSFQLIFDGTSLGVQLIRFFVSATHLPEENGVVSQARCYFGVIMTKGLYAQTQ